MKQYTRHPYNWKWTGPFDKDGKVHLANKCWLNLHLNKNTVPSGRTKREFSNISIINFKQDLMTHSTVLQSFRSKGWVHIILLQLVPPL